MDIENFDVKTVITAFFHVARDYAKIAHIHTIHDTDGNVYITDTLDIVAMQIMADAISKIKGNNKE